MTQQRPQDRRLRPSYLGYLALSVAFVALRGAQAADAGPGLGTEFGNAIFQQKCTACHGNPAMTGARAPDPAALRAMTPEAILASLTNGTMAPVIGNQLTDDEKRRVSESISGRTLGSLASGDAKNMKNQCAANPKFNPQQGASWNGWSVASDNARYQRTKSAGLTAEQVANLKVKWAFGFPNSVSAYSQPTLVGGRVFVASDNGFVYSLDANTGCVYWSFQAKAAIRNALSVEPIAGHAPAKHAVYFGDLKANVYALDAANGNLLWTAHVDDHFTSRVTAAPAYHAGKLFVPISGFEGFAAAAEDYPCCTFRGSVVALDANTGKQVWKRYMVEGEPKPTKKNSRGVQLWAPAGVSIWSTPTVDAKRNAIYVGTGDAATYPASRLSDAIVALDMKSGEVLWSFQGLAGDSFLVGCSNDSKRSENCPEHQGPDWDFGASPMLRALPNGKRVLVAGQKSGMVWGLDPDAKGSLVWKTNLLEFIKDKPDTLGLIVYGGAADNDNAYFALHTGGMVALNLTNGERAWYTSLLAPGRKPTDQDAGQSAAVSVIDGAAFVGGFDGRLHALSTKDGKILWQVNTAQTYDTINGVAAHGGAMGSAGPTIVGGALYVGSGYGVLSGAQVGNVLLKFTTK